MFKTSVLDYSEQLQGPSLADSLKKPPVLWWVVYPPLPRTFICNRPAPRVFVLVRLFLTYGLKHGLCRSMYTFNRMSCLYMVLVYFITTKFTPAVLALIAVIICLWWAGAVKKTNSTYSTRKTWSQRWGYVVLSSAIFIIQYSRLDLIKVVV